MTLEGYRVLAGEHDALFRVERPKVVAGVTNAAAEGDRSENAEYIYGRKRLREIDKRLAYLGHLIKDVDIVDPAALHGRVVCFGCTVAFTEDHDGKTTKKKWQVVGEGESDTARGTISVGSPMARALLGKSVGDVVTVERPAGELEVTITELWFGARRIA